MNHTKHVFTKKVQILLITPVSCPLFLIPVWVPNPDQWHRDPHPSLQLHHTRHGVSVLALEAKAGGSAHMGAVLEKGLSFMGMQGWLKR